MPEQQKLHKQLKFAHNEIVYQHRGEPVDSRVGRLFARLQNFVAATEEVELALGLGRRLDGLEIYYDPGEPTEDGEFVGIEMFQIVQPGHPCSVVMEFHRDLGSDSGDVEFFSRYPRQVSYDNPTQEGAVLSRLLTGLEDLSAAQVHFRATL